MALKDLFKMALSNLKRHRSRTSLTVLGIVIGTISIIMMVALGLGMQENFAESIENMGSVDIITVSKGDHVTSTTRLSEQEDDEKLGQLDFDFFSTLDYVEAVTPVMTVNAKIISGEYESTVSIVGIDLELFEVLGFEGFIEQEVEDNRLPLIFGQSAAESFDEASSTQSNQGGRGSNEFGGSRMGGGGQGGPPGGMQGGPQGRPQGEFSGGPDQEEDKDEEQSGLEELDVNVFEDRMAMSLDTSYSPMNQVASGTKVYRVQGSMILVEGDSTRDRNVYMDIEVLKELQEDSEGETIDSYDSAYLKVDDTAHVDAIVDSLEEYGYEATSMAEVVETIQSTTSMLQIALGAIGAIALLVAAIGITNTMIMAITERRREIGVMKVIGATVKDIKRLFLLEAAVIGFIGGVIGLGLCYGISMIIRSQSFGQMATGGMRGGGTSSLMQLNFSLPLWLIIGGIIFTTLVGIVSGYIPAKKAMACSALEAIQSQ